MYLLLISEITESSKQKLREWATIIAEEVEKTKEQLSAIITCPQQAHL
jgi:hypothetical protein